MPPSLTTDGTLGVGDPGDEVLVDGGVPDDGPGADDLAAALTSNSFLAPHGVRTIRPPHDGPPTCHGRS